MAAGGGKRPVAVQDRGMNHDDALARLDTRLQVAEALEVLQALDPNHVRLSCVEGFVGRDDGKQEARLDLIVDFGQMQQFTTEEQIRIAEMFIRNRAVEGTTFEIWGC